MKGEGVVAEITAQAFSQCIGGPIEEVLLKNEKSHEKKMMNQVSEIKSLAPQLKLEELVFYKKLGFGQFGSVFLVRQKNLDTFFALKSVLKAQVYEQGLEKYILVKILSINIKIYLKKSKKKPCSRLSVSPSSCNWSRPSKILTIFTSWPNMLREWSCSM